MPMSYNFFQEIETLHSQLAVMDPMTRLGWLTGERRRLNWLIDQMAQYVRAAGGFLNETERAYARELLEMVRAVEGEGAKAENELRSEGVKELVKLLIRG